MLRSSLLGSCVKVRALPGHRGAGRVAPAMADVDRDSFKTHAFADRARTRCQGQVSLAARIPGCPCAAWSFLAHAFGSHADWKLSGPCRVTGEREDASSELIVVVAQGHVRGRSRPPSAHLGYQPVSGLLQDWPCVAL